MKSITIPDDHDQAITILLTQLAEALPDHFSKNCAKSVLHIGAHKGEEVSHYIEFGFHPIFLVEANPNLVKQLDITFADNKHIHIIHRAISDSSGMVEFTIHQTQKGSVESASLLALKKLGEIVPVFNSENKINVMASTLDELVDELAFDYKNSLLCLDIQGAELMALNGASKLLKHVRAVICEVNLIENYEGGALEHQIVALLAEYGFHRYFTLYHELYNQAGRFPAWGEGLWIRP